jgi:GT2 family glycosyltransferase
VVKRVFIGIPSLGFCDLRFALALASLKKPPGAAISAVMRSPVDAARNQLTAQALSLGYDYIFTLDDDMVPNFDLLEKLLASMEADPSIDVLSPIAYRRKPPHTPCVFKLRRWPFYDPVEDVGKGILDVDATTFSATLIRSSALLKVSAPWFEFKTIEGQWIGEDMVLSKKLKDAGCRISCDTSLEVLHIAESPLIGRKAWEACKVVK